MIMVRLLYLFCLLAICDTAGNNANDSVTPTNDTTKTTTTVCPLNVTQNLPCLCHVLPKQQGIQIICQGIQPEKIWSTLSGYGAPIDKIALRECPDQIDLFQPIPNLKIRSLEITNCSISQIQPAAFDQLAGTLEELWLRNNALTTIPKLGKLKRLKAVSVNANQLKDLPDYTFVGLKELKQLRLRGNQICSLVNRNPLNDQKNTLELLDLSHNCMSKVPAAMLRGCMELRHLSLAGNNLDEVSSMQFMTLPNLIELRLHGNRLGRIQPNGFMNVPSLQLLFLQNNSLSGFDPGTLQAFKNLQLVDLSQNAFTKIPSFKDMAQLIEVRLDENQIGAIDTFTFSGNPKLQKISLAHNQINSIARNSFDNLDQLELLNLADNSLTNIKKGILEGMRHLKDLILRNNSLDELDRNSFASIPDLIGLDLGHNALTILRSGTFSPLQKLHSLKLENNKIESVEKGAFEGKIDSVLLDGNQLRCDDQLDWFIDWMVRNKVRTFVPDQPEIKCASPPERKGTRLKDLMIQRNNVTESLINSLHTLPGMGRAGGIIVPEGGAQGIPGNNLLANFIPGIARQTQGAQIGTQMLNSLAQSFPDVRAMPGMKFLPTGPQAGGQNGRTLDSAIDQFSQPLVKFASGIQPSPADVNQLLSSIPGLMINVPGFGQVDVSKLNPTMVEYILKGGQIPGIPRDTLNQMVKEYMQKLYAAAAHAQGIRTTENIQPLAPGTNTSRILRPISELPHGLVQSVVEGKPLPHLTTEQTNVVREYYTQHAPIGQLTRGDGNVNMTGLLPPKVLQMMQLLPRNYNLSNLPPEMVQQVMRGEMPDLTKLPIDLQQHIKDNFDSLIASLQNTPDLNVDEIMRNLPKFEQPAMSTFSPYDINSVDAELVVKQRKSEETARFWRLSAAIGLGLAGAITLGVLSAFCWYWHRTRAYGTGEENMAGPERSDGGRGLPTVVQEKSFRPSASSTLK